MLSKATKDLLDKRQELCIELERQQELYKESVYITMLKFEIENIDKLIDYNKEVWEYIDKQASMED